MGMIFAYFKLNRVIASTQADAYGSVILRDSRS